MSRESGPRSSDPGPTVQNVFFSRTHMTLLYILYPFQFVSQLFLIPYVGQVLCVCTCLLQVITPSAHWG
ncbi:uncharacterized protein BDW43DRAFT_295000 [Aspergillus alliaceus]|uniref:uncharacterized protein n=1 Tax=Petromyces alliaceus TaxID=209559 RepID=UPI0012A3BBFD|nr:uncharacterized protein BDW43DRAFT_295000 [Aspergillus alliaceus]KAB8227094.1 hypothetical protein BDW43DRAFT_295000 [Aspergillus alliaceus]